MYSTEHVMMIYHLIRLFYCHDIVCLLHNIRVSIALYEGQSAVQNLRCVLHLYILQIVLDQDRFLCTLSMRVKRDTAVCVEEVQFGVRLLFRLLAWGSRRKNEAQRRWTQACSELKQATSIRVRLGSDWKIPLLLLILAFAKFKPFLNEMVF